jgi:hypothetical protein
MGGVIHANPIPAKKQREKLQETKPQDNKSRGKQCKTPKNYTVE